MSALGEELTADMHQPLPRLTSLRWYAALVVFLLHLSLFLTWGPLKAFSFGQTGVAFFFVLSGFVLTWSSPPDLPARVFYRRRFARIYPSFLAMLLVGLVIAILIPDLLQATTVGTLAGLVFAPAWLSSHVGASPYGLDPPEWSLSCEAVFYALYPFLNVGLHRLSDRAKVQLAAAFLLLAMVVSGTLSATGHGLIAYYDPLTRSAEFVFGMALAMKVQAGWRPAVPTWLALALVGGGCELARVLTPSPVGSTTRFPFPLSDYAVVIPAGLLLAVAASADLKGRRGPLIKPLSVYLGELSFAFYLVHFLAMAVTLHDLRWDRAWGDLGGLAPLAVTFSASFAGAVALHHLVELPFQRLLRGTRPSVVVTAPALGTG